MPQGDTVSGREFSDFQRVYLANHKALADQLSAQATEMAKRFDTVDATLKQMNGTVKANGERTTRLEGSMNLVMEKLDEGETHFTKAEEDLEIVRKEVDEIRLDGCARRHDHERLLTSITTTSPGLSQGQKITIATSAATVGTAGLWEVIHHWTDIVKGLLGK